VKKNRPTLKTTYHLTKLIFTASHTVSTPFNAPAGVNTVREIVNALAVPRSQIMSYQSRWAHIKIQRKGKHTQQK